MSRLAGVVLFTAVELLTLVVWLVLAGVPFGAHIGAVLVLAVGLFVEHYISVNVGRGKRPLAALDP